MALNTKQKKLIVDLDREAKKILKNSDEAALLMSLGTKMKKIKSLLDELSKDELDKYCKQYDGFYRYMKLLEKLAQGTSKGLFDDIIK